MGQQGVVSGEIRKSLFLLPLLIPLTVEMCRMWSSKSFQSQLRLCIPAVRFSLVYLGAWLQGIR